MWFLESNNENESSMKTSSICLNGIITYENRCAANSGFDRISREPFTSPAILSNAARQWSISIYSFFVYFISEAYIRENGYDATDNAGANETDLVFLKGLLESPAVTQLIKVCSFMC